MNLAEYLAQIDQIPYGKRLPTALYVYREESTSFGEVIDALLAKAVARCGADARHNIIKFRLNELKLSFLSYPKFLTDPHPSLAHGITVDLVSGRSRHTDYTDNPNPPILHRKETFLPNEHSRRPLFSALTKAEEEADLYSETSTIGFKLNWDRLVSAKGLRYSGHKLVASPVDETAPSPASETPAVARHKTALVRYDLSKPVRTSLEYGQLRPGRTFFDYGCGQGADLNGLANLGHTANGWDPVYLPDSDKIEADVVNLGFVLNVIEDPAERLETLVDAFQYSRKLLVVSALIRETVDAAAAESYRDGVITKRKTFQKYYEQQELQQYIEDALDTVRILAFS